MTDSKDKDVAAGIGAVIKGYAKRLAGEIAPRPDLVVEGEKEQTEGLHRIRRSRQETAEQKPD